MASVCAADGGGRSDATVSAEMGTMGGEMSCIIDLFAA
jgi:hypothetical protein